MPQPRNPAEPDPQADRTETNPSQDDAPDQAQTVAEQAQRRASRADAGDTRRAPASGTDIADDGGSTPDVVDHVNQMASSGRIDMSAFRGERNDDDVEQGLGPQGVEDDFPRGAE